MANQTVGDRFEGDEFERLLDDAQRGAVTERDMDFVADMIEKFEQYGEKMFLSERQAAYLESLADL
jgi:hypothetical protein